MNHDDRTPYAPRDIILTLLADDDVAKVSPAERQIALRSAKNAWTWSISTKARDAQTDRRRQSAACFHERPSTQMRGARS